MPIYRYRPLVEGHIRVIELQPAQVHQPIRIEIQHALLAAPPTPHASDRLPLAELTKTLPSGWDVRETLEKRYIFDPPEELGEDATTWRHPDMSVPTACYETSHVVQDPLVDVQLHFEALSYRWVAEESHEEVLVLHQSSPAEVHGLRIGSHLASMLRSLRHETTSRTLWIDAICINQGDVSEKNKQVLRMADIYMLARRVVIYLGGESHDSALAMHTLQHLGQQVEYTTHCYFLPSPHCQQPKWHDPSESIPYDPTTWSAIANLLQREWFERLWVWQEVHLANAHTVVQCGSAVDSIISFYHFRTAILCLSAKLLPDIHLSTRLRFVASLVGVPPSPDYPLLWLIERTRAHRATDPRDRIYALLGWAKSLALPVVERIAPDYALPVGKVFEAAFRAEGEVSQSCNFLRMCTLGGPSTARELDAPPTWIPDLSQTPAAIPLDPYLLASSLSHAHLGPLISKGDSREVEVWAVLCGESVSWTSPAFHEGDPKGMETSLHTIHARITASHPSSSPESLPLIQSLTGGWTRDSWPELTQPCTLATYLASYESHLQITTTTTSTRTTSISTSQDPFLSRLSKHMNGRKIFQTGNGNGNGNERIGAAPHTSTVGDIIAVILGCQTPILLRPTTHDRRYHQVVGECYVPGLMNGEALLGELPPGWRCETRTHGETGRWTLSFSHEETGRQMWEDPRSEDLRRDLEPEVLLARGVEVKRIILV